jgi:uncharacterized protein (TIRG00374 family)
MEIDRENKARGKINWQNIFSFAARIIIGTLLLYFIITLVRWENVLTAYKSADGRFILIAFILLIANISLRTFKWFIMLKSVKKQLDIREAFGSLMLGISLGSFTPVEIGEFAGRAIHVSDARRSHMVGLALLDKVQIFIIIGGFGLSCFALQYIQLYFFKIFVSLSLFLISLYLFFNMKFIASVGHRINSAFFKRPLIGRILDGFTLLNKSQVFSTSCLTIAFHITIALQMFFLLNAFYRVSLYDAFIGTSIMMFVKSLLPISIGDLGVREASSIFFFSVYGIPDASALNASLLLFVINILTPSLVGIYFLRHKKLPLNMFRQIMNRKTGPGEK